MTEYYVGIDCGLHTGWAVWNVDKKDYDIVTSTTFWGCIGKINEMTELCNTYGHTCTYVIENPNHNSPTFERKLYRKGRWIPMPAPMQDNISQRVGMNKRDAQLLIQYCRDHFLDVIESTPTKNSWTKLTHEKFVLVTGYKNGKTNSHGRDAAMLVFKIK